ncbi:MAG: FHA domain-containing protein [Calothrix sp. C42_A2020_038]|nr:FHA domain-containing protein [Calothrix sp. C42_A2020_038]
MITLSLIHPQESLPPQSWTFEGELIIRIGRASDNHVVIYSAVVSRHHVEVRRVNQGWEIVSLGANGTYINGEKILQSRVDDGVIFRLARSGPQIQIRLEPDALATVNQMQAKYLEYPTNRH